MHQQQDEEFGQVGRLRGPPAPGNVDNRGLQLLTVLGFLFLTFNSAMAIHGSNGDPSSIALVAFSYIDLVALFYCLRRFDRNTPESPKREWLKMAVWLLTTMLTAAFSYKVVVLMPFPVAVLVWAMAFVTVAGGFYTFFMHQEDSKAPQP